MFVNGQDFTDVVFDPLAVPSLSARQDTPNKDMQLGDIY